MIQAFTDLVGTSAVPALSSSNTPFSPDPTLLPCTGISVFAASIGRV